MIDFSMIFSLTSICGSLKDEVAYDNIYRVTLIRIFWGIRNNICNGPFYKQNYFNKNLEDAWKLL